MSKESLNELCQRALISEYLEARGVELRKSGSRLKCKCPLPDHEEDNTPSFYIGEFDDGGQYFKCFGCNATGNVITLIRLMEGKENKVVVRELSSQFGVELGKFDPGMRLEPLPEDVLSQLCDEEMEERQIVSYAKRYLKDQKGSFDAVNKISRMYQKMDRCLENGDPDGMNQVKMDIIELMISQGKS